MRYNEHGLIAYWDGRSEREVIEYYRAAHARRLQFADAAYDRLHHSGHHSGHTLSAGDMVGLYIACGLWAAVACLILGAELLFNKRSIVLPLHFSPPTKRRYGDASIRRSLASHHIGDGQSAARTCSAEKSLFDRKQDCIQRFHHFTYTSMPGYLSVRYT